MLKAIRLRTEYLENPIGIDISEPRFYWNVKGNSKEQTAYEVRASHTLDDLNREEYIWESGKMQSSDMVHIPYGAKVYSRERIYWQVRIWDEHNNPGEWSESAYFEMGLLRKEDWSANWITGNYEPEEGRRYPVDEFRKVFRTDKIAKARLYITACGVYEVYLNRERVGNQILTPGSTSYEKRMHYQTYDVTNIISEGANTWDISLGDGWYRGKLGVFGATNVFGNTTSVFAQLELTDETGAVSYVVTDDGFTWSNDGPIRFNDLKDGETVAGGCIPSYNGMAKITEWETKLCCSNNVHVVEKESFIPKVLVTQDGSKVLDFGQNIAGYVAFSVKGEKDHTVKMTLGEMLDEAGNFTLKNLVTEDTTPDHIPDYCDDSRFQSIIYICGSSDREYWKPKFCIQGFQYVKLENWPEEVMPEHFKAITVCSDMEVTERFKCSSDNLNRLVDNTLWSIKGNFLDVPTDCPTRERAAWCGDAQLFFDTGCYFMDFTAFFRKWIRDIYDDQALDGKVYNIVPRVAEHGGMNEFVEGSSGWTDAGILIPYRFWKNFGDNNIIENLYQPMTMLAEYMIKRMGDESDPELEQKLPSSEYRKYIVTTGFHFGEWNEPGSSPMDVIKPKYEEATAYLSYSLGCLSEMALAIGRVDDSDKYHEISEKANAAYQYYFCKNETIESDRMCKYVRPLALNLLSKQTKENAELDLIKLVREKQHHIGTGFLSTPFVLKVISDAGYLEDAYKMLERESYPSWIYEIEQGATTVWENWDGVASRNHYSNGAVCEWIFNTICGVSVVGNNYFSIVPRPGGTLKYAEFSYQSMYGEVSSKWKIENDTIIYKIKIPTGCKAKIELEGIDAVEVCAGEYTYKL